MTTTRGTVRALAVAGLAGVALAACGSQSDLSAAAGQVLQRDAAAVAAAARTGNAGLVNAALTRLRTDVAQRRAAGQLSAARATRILDAGARVALDVVTVHKSPTRPVAPVQPLPAKQKSKDGGGDGGDGGD